MVLGCDKNIAGKWIYATLTNSPRDDLWKKQINIPTVINLFIFGELLPAQSTYSAPTNSNYELLQAAIEYSMNKNVTTSNQP